MLKLLFGNISRKYKLVTIAEHWINTAHIHSLEIYATMRNNSYNSITVYILWLSKCHYIVSIEHLLFGLNFIQYWLQLSEMLYFIIKPFQKRHTNLSEVPEQD